MDRRIAWVVLVVAGMGVYGYNRARRSKPVTSGDEPIMVPALQAGEDEGLRVEVTQERTPGGRRFRLALGGGAAILTLKDAKGSGGFAFGKGTIEPVDRDSGGKFVDAVARWLGQPSPMAGRAGPLEAVPLSYVRLGSDGAWEANKLFFESGNRSAEVFFNVTRDGTRARFVEKDEDYREPLVLSLAEALRDGARQRRTPADDPNVAAPEPLLTAWRPVAGGEDMASGAWTADGYLARTYDDRRSTVLFWKDLSAPPRKLAEVDGDASSIFAAPTGGRIALLVVYPRDSEVRSSDDPAAVMLLDAAGAASLLVQSDATFTFGTGTQLEWSPNGKRLTLVGSQGKLQARKVLTRVYDVATKTVVATTDAAGGSPQRAMRSPDGKYGVEAKGSALLIAGPGGAGTFASTNRDDQEALKYFFDDEPQWLGGHRLLLHSDELVALDLESRKLQYVLPKGMTHLVGASPDGKRAGPRRLRTPDVGPGAVTGYPAVVRRLLFVLLGGMCMGGICGGGDPPRPDVCDGPMTRAPIDAIEIGQPGSTFQPLEDGYVSRVVTGPQGGSMLEFRLRVSGAQVPECVEQMITVSEQGRRIGALNTPLKTYPDAAGTRSTKSLFVIFESSTTMPVVTGEVTAEAGGKSVTKSITIRY